MLRRKIKRCKVDVFKGWKCLRTDLKDYFVFLILYLMYVSLKL